MEHVGRFAHLYGFKKAFQRESALRVGQQIMDYFRFLCCLAFVTFKAIDFFRTATSALSVLFSFSRKRCLSSRVWGAFSVFSFSGMVSSSSVREEFT